MPVTNPLERVSGEIARRTEVVGIFPDEAAITGGCRADGSAPG
jgi:transposase-like protein